jgi:hypothetical protein
MFGVVLGSGLHIRHEIITMILSDIVNDNLGKSAIA